MCTTMCIYTSLQAFPCWSYLLSHVYGYTMFSLFCMDKSHCTLALSQYGWPQTDPDSMVFHQDSKRFMWAGNQGVRAVTLHSMIEHSWSRSNCDHGSNIRTTLSPTALRLNETVRRETLYHFNHPYLLPLWATTVTLHTKWTLTAFSCLLGNRTALC